MSSNLLTRLKKLEESFTTTEIKVAFVRKYPSGEVTRIIVGKKKAELYRKEPGETELQFLERVEELTKLDIATHLSPFDAQAVLERAKENSN